MKLKLIALLVVVLIVVGWVFGRPQPGERSPAVRTAGASAQAGAAIDPAMRSYVEATVRAAGYECPSLNSLRAFGEGARGTIVRAWCGPAGADSLLERQVYRLDVGPRGAIRRVTVWAGSPDTAPAR